MRAYMIIDGQWGSTGKGLICGYLARKWEPDALVCNFGPNAGHTFVTVNGAKIITRQLPTGIVSNSVKNIFIGPGSIIDPNILIEELEEFADLLKGKKVYIHERAVMVSPIHRMMESKQLARISSTQKGSGAALADKASPSKTGPGCFR